MTAKTDLMLRKLLRGRPRYSVAEIKQFVVYFSKMSDSKFESECKRVAAMNAKPSKPIPAPPAGLKAKQAVPVMLAYIREEKGETIDLSREERGSFSALVDALDRRFGVGFTQRVIDELNAMPNASYSLHYKK